MLINYLSGGCFIASIFFIIGLWFGSLRGYEIYQYKRASLIFITLVTIAVPVVTFLAVSTSSQSNHAEIFARYGAIAGFLIAALYVEYLMRPKKVRRAPLASPALPEQSQPSTNNPLVIYRNLRLSLYFIIVLLLLLFPPYYESWTHNRAWVLIVSGNVRPFFVLDLTFLLYELILTAAVCSGIEFWMVKSQNGTDTTRDVKRIKNPPSHWRPQ